MLCLNFQYCLLSTRRCFNRVPQGPLTLVQEEAMGCLEDDTWLMLCCHPEPLRWLSWQTELEQKRIAYDGSEVTMPASLTLAQVEAGLPPIGVAGSIDARRYAEGEVLRILYDPSIIMKDAREMPERPKRTRVWATEEEWNLLMHACWQRSMVVACQRSDAITVGGEPAFIGSFGVVKP